MEQLCVDIVPGINDWFQSFIGEIAAFVITGIALAALAWVVGYTISRVFDWLYSFSSREEVN